MPRDDRPDPSELVHKIFAFGEDAPGPVEKARLLEEFRRRFGDLVPQLDSLIIRELAHGRAECDRLGEGLREARENQAKLKAMLDKYTEPPWHPATYLGSVSTSLGDCADVLHGGMRRVVGLGEELDVGGLRVGEEVFLSSELNLILGRSPHGLPPTGETATFERALDESRIVARWRDEEVVLELADELREAPLEPGQPVRWRRDCYMAFEILERTRRTGSRVENPRVGRDQVGGQDENLERLLFALLPALLEPERAAAYGLGGGTAVLMVGPSGCGKTLMARVAASEVARVTSGQCPFSHVKPGEWENMYVGETQRNIRECFQNLREDANGGPAILFMDEIESIGRARGTSLSHHQDLFLDALLAELDGFEGRGNIAVIAATNRKDLLDPALLERLFEVEISVSRPDQRGARAIFGIHLPAARYFSPNGNRAPGTRQEAIDAAVSAFYSPNCDNELCVIRFRDGKTRTVVARELASGRVFEQVSKAAARSAVVRGIHGGDYSVRVTDVVDAAAQAINSMRSILTRRNADLSDLYIPDLPQDVGIATIEPVRRKVSKPHRYLTLSAA